MPDKKIKPGMRVQIVGNVYDSAEVEQILNLPLLERVGVIQEAGEMDDAMWGQHWWVHTASGRLDLSEQDLSPLLVTLLAPTSRGFGRVDFIDLYGSNCSIQESSLASERALWLGINSNGSFELFPPYSKNRADKDTDTGGRMHLSQGMIAALLPLLQQFVDGGGLEKTAE